MKRRDFLRAGLYLPLMSVPLLSCDRSGHVNRIPNITESTYLQGMFAPVTKEVTATDLLITGSLPKELKGRFLRNGPNPRGEVDPSSHHWFIGDGMIHGVHIGEGKADWYRNRWVMQDTGGVAPNTHVISHAGRTWALVESGSSPVELGDHLESLGTGFALESYTAHPKIDPEDGSLHSISYNWGRWHTYVQYQVVDAQGQFVKSVDIPLPDMTMIHDMSLTANYVVIYDMPVNVSLTALIMGSRFPFRWDADHEPRVGLLPRNGQARDIIWSSVQPGYVYHAINAYEEDSGKVIIDLCHFGHMFDGDIHGPLGDSRPTLDRWTIDPDRRTVNEERIDDRPQDMPRCHPGHNSKPYRYAYTLMMEDVSSPGIYKYDMRTGDSQSYYFEPGQHSGEPVFVPQEGGTEEDGTEEDEGYLMTYVFDEKTNKSDLVVLDAQDFMRPPLARIHLPVRVPHGFHGSWITDNPVISS